MGSSVKGTKKCPDAHFWEATKKCGFNTLCSHLFLSENAAGIAANGLGISRHQDSLLFVRAFLKPKIMIMVDPKPWFL